jgi:peptidoglycan/LPS O-acetylase OafA/YrhL
MMVHKGAMRAAPRHLLTIDLLRFASAAFVMAFHFLTVFPLADQAVTRDFDPAMTLPADGARWTWCGWVGVEIFFVLSGYVIAWSAIGTDRATFLWRRVLRLVPAAWICASVTLAVLLAGGVAPGEAWPRWVHSVLFLPHPEQIDAPYWTLRVEIAFYLVVALALGAARPARALDRLAMGLAGWSATYWATAWALGMAGEQAIVQPALGTLLLPHGAFFALGLALSAVAANGWTRGRVAVVAVSLATGTAEIVVHAGAMRAMPMVDARPLVPVLLFWAAVVALYGARRIDGVLLKRVPSRACRTLGDLTYPLYLLNMTAGAGLIVGLVHAGLGKPAAMGVAAVTVLAAAYLVARIGEPAVRRRLALLRRRGRAPDTLPTASLPAG